jgi:outer membrane protein assembly factor BamA
MWAALVVVLLGVSDTGLTRVRVVSDTGQTGVRPVSDTQAEILTAVQVHGNTATSDDEVRRLAGVQPGMPVEPSTIDEITARLRATKRFETVQVLKRFASISDPSQIVLVIIVDEGPVKIELTGDPDHPTRVVRKRRLAVMLAPIISYEDGYGGTYGVRIARPNVAGTASRLSFPLTWGGEKRAGAELDKTLAGAPIDRLTVGASLTRRTNPFFDEDDDRRRVWLRAERELVRGVRAGATGGWQRVSFFGVNDAFTHAGVDLVVDTRVDPMLARNAVYARVAWEHLRFSDADGVNRTDLDVRGYVGLLGQSILAVRAQREDANRPLPPYLKSLLGGMPNLRGFHAGTAAGDTLAGASAELIIPLTSPLSVGKIGVSAFIDAATVYDKGERLSDQVMREGFGGSVWFSAAFLRLNVAVAHGRGSGTRVHVGGAVTF